MDIKEFIEKGISDVQTYVNGVSTENATLKEQNATLQADNKSVKDQLNQASVQYQQALTDKSKIESAYNELKSKPVATKRGRLGINWHLYSDPAYNNIDLVIQRTLDLFITWARQDFDVDGATGKMKFHDKFLSQWPKILAAGIEIRPMLYARGIKLSGTPEGNFNQGYFITDEFLKLYGQYFKEIEIGNEQAIPLLLEGTTGDQAADYDKTKLVNSGEFLRGMYMAALKYPVKIIVSTEWLHQYYIDYLRSIGVNAAISLHMYTDAFKNAEDKKKMNIYTWLKKLYGPMFIEVAETNYMMSTTSAAKGTAYSEKVHMDTFLPEFDKQLASGLDIMLFELFDRINSKGREGWLGMYRSDGTPKLIVAEIKNRLAA